MKKIWLLLGLVLLLPVSSVFGEFQTIGSSALETISFDTNTIRIKLDIRSEDPCVDVYIKHQFTEAGI